MKNPYAGIEDEDRIGRTIYSKHCKFCHATKGKGDGNQANLLQTKVADLTIDEFKNQTDGSIYYKVYTGRNEMPGFEKIIMEEEDMWMVLNYIKKFLRAPQTRGFNPQSNNSNRPRATYISCPWSI